MSAADRIRRGTPSDAAAAAALHIESISIGFLVVLGERFLERLYRRVAGRRPVVRASYTSTREQGRRLRRRDRGHRPAVPGVHVRDGVHAGLRAAPAVLRHPWKVIETFRYGMDGRSAKPGRGDPGDRGRGNSRGEGIGRALVATATDELRRRGIEHAHVVTAATTRPHSGPTSPAGSSVTRPSRCTDGVVQEVLVWP